MILNKKLLLILTLFVTIILCTSSVGAQSVSNVITADSNNGSSQVSDVNEENGTDVYVHNDHNDDLTDSKYENPNDYYFDENGNRVNYTSDTRSFNNVTMSNGYNAYAIHHSGYLETNDSKTHPIFWNDTFKVVSPDHKGVVVGHWHLTNATPIGEFLKILIYEYLDAFNNINNPNVPNSIYLQSYIWDFYDNVNNYDGLSDLNKRVVDEYNNGTRVNNTGNIKWTNSTHYKIYDFMGFQNMNSTHMNMWGFKITEVDVPQPSNNTTNGTNSTNSTPVNPGNTNNTTSGNNTNGTNTTPLNPNGDNNIISYNDNNNSSTLVNNVPLLNTGNPLYMVFLVLIVLGLIPFNRRIKK